MSPSRKKSKRRAIVDDVLEWMQTGLDWGSNINSVVPIPAYGLIAPVLSALIKQIAVRMACSFTYRLYRSSFSVQAARTNKRAAADVLEKIQTLANIIGDSREELVSRIAPLLMEDQQTVHGGVPEKPSFQDPFDEFLKYVLLVGVIPQRTYLRF